MFWIFVVILAGMLLFLAFVTCWPGFTFDIKPIPRSEPMFPHLPEAPPNYRNDITFDTEPWANNWRFSKNI